MLMYLQNVFVITIFLICAIVSQCIAIDNIHLPAEFEVILPKVFHDDNIEISPSQILFVMRQRRSVSSHIFINISTHEETFYIRLEPNLNLLAPGFKIYHRHVANNITTETDDVTDSDRECLYKGIILSHNDAPAAFSLCKGVAGVLMLPHDDFVVEPLPEHMSSMYVHSSRGHYSQDKFSSNQKAGSSTWHTKASKSQHHTNDTLSVIDSLQGNNITSSTFSQHTHGDQISALDDVKKFKAADIESNKPVPHILYRRSALPKHTVDNYEASTAFNRYAKSSQTFHRNRRKRSFTDGNQTRSVETLVVVDQEMYRNHRRDNISTYVLSIFNIVSQLYQDSSLGYPINIVLIGLMFLDDKEPGLHIGHHADKTLNSFCQWQAGIHNGHTKQHDHAVLLTGKDICSYQDAPCDTLGFAPIDGMCNEWRSCIVNEDTGLSTAFTIAHEMGHNFGMMHDGDENHCKEATGFIMSPTLSAQSGIFHWSSCSRHYMRKFLNKVQSECLTSQSRRTAELSFPKQQPGEIYDADAQCKWQFGSHSKKCHMTFGRDPCKSLFCHKREGMCETKFLPAAEGTSCGNGMWCQQAQCVSYNSRESAVPVHGWWTEWGSWSQCTRLCGGGIKTRTRACNTSRVHYGKQACNGNSVEHKICNLLDCENSEKDYRELQCKQLVQEKLHNLNYHWRSHRKQSYSDVEDQCKLYCKADDYEFYYALPQEAMDGTQCNLYSTDVCVQGKCQHVGCDLIVGSSAKKDKCGICMGDNSTCKVVENTFKVQPKEKAYVAIVYLPSGSSSIMIDELRIAPSNYLALRNIQGKYYLNGDWQLNSEGLFTIGGAKFIYRRSYNKPESLTSEGPLLEDLVLEVLLQSENLGIHYSFTVPKSLSHIPTVHHNFTWTVTLTECTQPCAGGSQIVTAHCRRDHSEEVHPSYCDKILKPATGSFACNIQLCEPRWVTDPWEQCSRHCGGGKQKRHVYCMQKLSQTKDHKTLPKFCDRARKPQHKQECNTHVCPPVWYKGPWSECSVTCGKGLRSRTVVCHSKTPVSKVVLPDSMCTQQLKPDLQQVCKKLKCPDPSTKWFITAWSQCSSSCNQGIRVRKVHCMYRKQQSKRIIVTQDKRCSHLQKPDISLTEACHIQSCDQTKLDWYTSPWSQCSASCGVGKQSRVVRCIHLLDRQLSDGCDLSLKPTHTKLCHEMNCSSPGFQCLDQYPWCHLVPKHNICDHIFYGTKCCLSCHRT